jgi:phosphohistidine phosphatase
MKTLFILRHAKSSWDQPDLADFDRPLNDRGEAAAPFMGQVMKREGFEPEVILSSPAARAKATASLARESAGIAGEIVFDEQIYEASVKTLREVVSGIDDKFRSAMIVGHNPGMEGFVHFLTGSVESMPTAALAVIDIDVASWSDIDARRGTLRTVIRPKDEMKRFGKGN